MHETPEVLTAIHPIQDGSSQQNRKDDLGGFDGYGVRFHGDKGTNNY